MASPQLWSGLFGSIKDTGGNSLAQMTRFTLSTSSELKSFRSTAQGAWNRRVPGGRDWLGMMDVLLPRAQQQKFRAGTRLTDVEFHISETGNDFLRGDIIIAAQPLLVDIEGGRLVGGTVRFAGSGPLTEHGALVTSEELSSSGV